MTMTIIIKKGGFLKINWKPLLSTCLKGKAS